MPLDTMTLIQLGVLALVALVLGLFVVRPILTSQNRPVLPAAMDSGDQEIFPPTRTQGIGSSSMPEAQGQMIESESEPEADPVTRLRQLIEERQDETIQILQDWIEEPDRKESA